MELSKIQGHKNGVETTFQFLISQRSEMKYATSTVECFSLREDIENLIHCKGPLKDKIERNTKVPSGLMIHYHYFVIFNSKEFQREYTTKYGKWKAKGFWGSPKVTSLSYIYIIFHCKRGFWK